MQIDLEFLTKVREQAIQQVNRLAGELNQAKGALTVIDAMIQRLNMPDEQKEDQ